MLLENISIIIPTTVNEPALPQLLDDLKHLDAEIIISSEGTRAKSLNMGAAKAQHKFLWFLHADSRVTKQNLMHLEKSLYNHPNDLHYFYLAFDGRGFTMLNALGANIRSYLFGLPYGDQGLCISLAQFKIIGGYPENMPYGEDLIFVRLAKKSGVKLNCISSKLLTSSRKYQTQGWLKLTVLRQWQLFKCLRHKL